MPAQLIFNLLFWCAGTFYIQALWVIGPDKVDFELKMKIRTGLFLLWTAFVLWTCSDNDRLVDKRKLTGRYIIQTHKLDTVDINSDGTFIRFYENEQLPGKWTYDSITGYLKLEDFWYSDGDWNTKVRQKENEIHLIYATDISGGYYLRIDSTDRKN